jgi:putative transposase
MERIHSRNRKTIRLKEYDYSRAGAYFITICTYQRQLLFGNIINETMQLNDFGKIVEEEWKKTEQIRKEIIMDAYCVMPNHFHGIVIITDDDEQKQNPVGTNSAGFHFET